MLCWITWYCYTPERVRELQILLNKNEEEIFKSYGDYKSLRKHAHKCLIFECLSFVFKTISDSNLLGCY